MGKGAAHVGGAILGLVVLGAVKYLCKNVSSIL